MDSSPDLPKVLLSKEQIAGRVRELADQISADYAGRELLVIGVLKGSWIFLADLVRLITVSVTVDFMMASSYGSGTDSSGMIKVVLDPRIPLENRDVLVVDDILDSGLTLKHIIDDLNLRKPHSLRIAALLGKPDRRRTDIRADYVGFQIPDKFLVGYGLDFAERFRNLPYVGYI